MGKLREAMRPEFINRIDDIVLFRKLSQEQLRSIVDLLLQDTALRLLAQDMTLSVSDAATDWLAEHGYEPSTAPGPSAGSSSARSTTASRPSWSRSGRTAVTPSGSTWSTTRSSPWSTSPRPSSPAEGAPRYRSGTGAFLRAVRFVFRNAVRRIPRNVLRRRGNVDSVHEHASQHETERGG